MYKSDLTACEITASNCWPPWGLIPTSEDAFPEAQLVSHSNNHALIWLGLMLMIMQAFVCRVVWKEWMKNASFKSVFAVCWAIGVLIFGTFMHLTTNPLDAWLTSAFLASPISTVMALAIAEAMR